MQIDSTIRKLLVEPLLGGALSAAIDDFVLNTALGPVPLTASIRCDGDANEILADLRDPEARDFAGFFPRMNHFGSEDTLTATGTLAGRIRIKIAEIWPPANTSTTLTRALKMSSATMKVGRIEVEPTPRTLDAGGTGGSREFDHFFILAKTALKFRNTVQKQSVSHPFWGKSCESDTVSWDGIAFNGSFSLMPEGEHLKVGFRHQAEDVEEAKSRAEALLDAIGFVLAINPWPSYVRMNANGRTVEEYVRSLNPAQGKMVPLRERQAIADPDAPTKLIASVAAWIHALSPEDREDVTHALWVFRSADHKAAPAPVKLAMIGAVIEGLLDASHKETAPDDFADFRNEAVAWASEVAVKSKNPERSALANRLASYLRNWSFQDRRTGWKKTFSPLFPGKDLWLNGMFDVFQKRRNPPAHGDFVASLKGDSRELLSDLGRLAGFVNLVIAAKAGYQGPILESAYDDVVMNLEPTSPPATEPI